jgi:hypothetical protein
VRARNQSFLARYCRRLRESMAGPQIFKLSPRAGPRHPPGQETSALRSLRLYAVSRYRTCALLFDAFHHTRAPVRCPPVRGRRPRHTETTTRQAQAGWHDQVPGCVLYALAYVDGT